MDWNNHNQAGRRTWSFEEALSLCLAKVFVRMFAALVVTALAAVVVVLSPTLQNMVLNSGYGLVVLLIAEIAMVIGISAGINKMSSQTAGILFFTYAVINGLTLSVIFFAYEIRTIYLAFFITALMFAAMALYGYTSKKDLSSVGSLCFMGLIGIIIAGIANFFFRSDMLDTLICFAGVLIFVGLTAYDTQKIKGMLAEASSNYGNDEIIRKISVIGALSLYLDFIGLFLKLLRLLGKARN